MLRTAWKIYYTFVVTGVIAGTASYAIATLVDHTPFAVFLFPMLPLIVVFCLTLSLPLAGMALLVFRVLDAGFGPRPKQWWRLMGAASGLFFVAIALISNLSVGAFGNEAGRIFWLTFLVAAAIAGARAATISVSAPE